MSQQSDHGAAQLAAVRERLHTACLTIGCLPGDGPKGFFSTWPAYRHEWWDWGAELSRLSDADIARRFLAPPPFTPRPRDVDDCLPALDLMAGCSRAARIVVSARAAQEWYGARGGWRAIGRAAGISHVAARSLHWSTCVLALERTLRAAA